MLLFVELCVDLRKGKSAKDGLYQYKNIAQNTNVGTIEVWTFSAQLPWIGEPADTFVVGFEKIH